MKILTVEEMVAAENAANQAGITYEMMMCNAGKGIAAWIYDNLSIDQGVIGLVGSGNNGGDTLIALTDLALRGIRTLAFLVKERKNDLLIEDYLKTSGSLIEASNNEGLNFLDAALRPGTVLLDGILGTGFRLPLREDLGDVMGSIYQIVKNRPEALVVAVDCPSGMDCNTGEVSKVIFRADTTLCLAAIKQGLLKTPGSSFVGTIALIDIGIGKEFVFEEETSKMLCVESVRPYLPERPASAHKGTFGTCLVIAGTAAFTGAAYLTGKAAYLSGCGLVHIATLPAVQQSLAGTLVEAVWTLLPGADGAYGQNATSILENIIPSVDSVVLGPGLGLENETAHFIAKLLPIIPKQMPVLVDADGLKHLNFIENWWQQLPQNVILTPHPGEMATLTGLSISEIQKNRWEISEEYASKWQVTLILKGANSVIASSQGEVWVNPICEPALATAGSGDVLSGVIGGLLAQGIPLPQAGMIGTWLHAQAGINAKRMVGTDISVTAMDILESIPSAFRLCI